MEEYQRDRVERLHRPRLLCFFGAALPLVSFVVGLLLWLVAAHSREQYPGQYSQVDDATREWFRGVRSPSNVPCCDVADGHRTPYETREAVYFVPIEGEMRPVPPEAIVLHSRNPTGDAIVWYSRQTAGGVVTFFIRCFVLPELG